MTAKIQLNNVYKEFVSQNNTLVALENIDLAINEGEFVVIVGASGCGKTTLINHIAGFVQPTSGEVLLDDKPIVDITPQCGMIFQQYALFPWKTVKHNVEFGPKMKGLSKSECQKIGQEFIDLVGLNGFEDAYPEALSGGMKQRVSIARVLANNPDVILLDEPFAALDAMTRQVLQEELLRIYEQHKKTVIFITHSIDEALLLSSRIIIMTARPGTIAQDITNDLPYPRDASVQLSQGYIDIKKMIWETVQQEVIKSMETRAK